MCHVHFLLTNRIFELHLGPTEPLKFQISLCLDLFLSHVVIRCSVAVSKAGSCERGAPPKGVGCAVGAACPFDSRLDDLLYRVMRI